MSLDPRDSQRRGRDKSPGRERSRSRVAIDEVETVRERSRVRVASPPSSRYDDPRDSRGSVYEYEDRKAAVVTAEPRGMPGGFGDDDYDDPRGGRGGAGRGDERGDRYTSSTTMAGGRGGREKDYYSESTRTTTEYGGRGGEREKEYYTESKTERGYGGRGGRDEYSGGRGGGGRDDYARPIEPPSSRSQYEEVDKYKYSETTTRGDSRYADDRPESRERTSAGRERGASFNISAGKHSISGGVNVGGGMPSPGDYQYAPPPATVGRKYAEPPKYEYAQPSEQISYSKTQETVYNTRPTSPPSQYATSSKYDSRPTYESARTSQTKVLTIEGPDSRRRAPSPGPSSLAPRMHSLSVSTGHHGGAALSLATAPGSPLLEAYHGTYQSISPMPSPLMMPSKHHGDVNFIEALGPDSDEDDRRRGKPKRTARFHDPIDEATILAKALKGEKRAPDTAPLIEILPGLTHEQILDLRVEYKKLVKTGSEKKGVNIAKHIKLRLKDEDPSLMKACYACALGRWESEAYWANFWYQGEKSRRELLIESLMGRTNAEIRQIKDGFSDKKYGDSLTKCMKTELKEDKFKKAVLLVLEEKKMEESNRVDRGLVADDVSELHRAVRSEKGGESAMIGIIVVRSEGHMREVLRSYEANYKTNFAREMLRKSGNLVGELLAHILNGIINAPVRDAMLIHHALSLSRSDGLRTELLISRLVRYHWDRPHMEAVKREYRQKYGVDMRDAVREGTKGEVGRFLEGLCVRRMGDEVRSVERYSMVEERYSSVGGGDGGRDGGREYGTRVQGR